MNNEPDNSIFEFFLNLTRQAPGDDKVVKDLLAKLGDFPQSPRIADLGCGTGKSTRVLAKHFNTPIYANDISQMFLDRMMLEAEKEGIGDLIHPICGDMAETDNLPENLDLIWSEGSAYLIGFENALKAWKPLLKKGGKMVISECTWTTDTPPPKTKAFWDVAYPAIGTKEQNVQRAKNAGYKVLHSEWMPVSAWDSFYGEMAKKAKNPETLSLSPEFQNEIKEELELYYSSEGSYGYLILILEK